MPDPKPQTDVSDLQDRFINDEEQEKLTNLSRTTRWRLERRGEFPKSYKISPNRSARRLSEILAWMQARTGQPERVA